MIYPLHPQQSSIFRLFSPLQVPYLFEEEHPTRLRNILCPQIDLTTVQGFFLS